MIVTCVHVHVKSDHIDAFIEATLKNHRQSIQEPSNLRFDVLQDPKNETHFMLYEAYENSEGAAAHKQMAHYLEWRETVADWMAKPREGIPYKGIAP